MGCYPFCLLLSQFSSQISRSCKESRLHSLQSHTNPAIPRLSSLRNSAQILGHKVQRRTGIRSHALQSSILLKTAQGYTYESPGWTIEDSFSAWELVLLLTEKVTLP
eukprot:TRINITY_DN24318_c0_g1_i1.p1 TRINITY_DN24318_c0_g1~~TRINITY_DN24318_c0_g1_i1.p1  ORF type:complete len:107 (-),score=15.46 TRINITY_DN24318_c0_g1_i1:255-575(-)